MTINKSGGSEGSVRQLKKIQVCETEVGQSAPGGSGDFVPLPLLRAADVNDKTAL